MAKNKNNAVETEIVAPVVETQAAVQIALNIEDGIKPAFDEARYHYRQQLRDIIQRSKEARAAAQKAKDEFIRLISEYDDPEATSAIGARKDAAVAIVEQLRDQLPIGEVDVDVYQRGHEIKDRMRMFRVTATVAADNGDGKYEPKGSARVNFEFSVPFSEAQCALLDEEAKQKALADELEVQAQKIGDYVNRELPELEQLLTAKAKRAWMGKAKGVEEVYTPSFYDNMFALITGAAAKVGLDSGSLAIEDQSK